MMLVVFHLTDSRQDGHWQEMDPAWDQTMKRLRRHSDTAVRMVPTGDVEWRQDGAAAEVWVPEDRLSLWLSEYREDDL